MSEYNNEGPNGAYGYGITPEFYSSNGITPGTLTDQELQSVAQSMKVNPAPAASRPAPANAGLYNPVQGNSGYNSETLRQMVGDTNLSNEDRMQAQEGLINMQNASPAYPGMSTPTVQSGNTFNAGLAKTLGL